MPLTSVEWGKLFTLTMIALAMGTDAFSFGIGLGTRRPAITTISKVSMSVGFFHIVMPLIGMGIGQLLDKVMKDVAVMVGGGMLCFLGISMLWHVLKKEEERRGDQPRIYSWGGIFLLSISVSLDSLSAGLSLGLFDVEIWLTLLLFGVLSFAMTGTGLVLGRFMGHWIGVYGELIGGIILLYLGSQFII